MYCNPNFLSSFSKKGITLREELNKLPGEIIETVRGKGLLNAIAIRKPYSALDLCIRLRDNGLLASRSMSKLESNYGDIVRFAPPLSINDDELAQCIEIIDKSVRSFL